MHVQIEVTTEIEIKQLEDLIKYKELMENLNMKINKSKLGRDLGVDRRTVDRYLSGKDLEKKRVRASKIDPYYEIILDLLSDKTPQTFYYKKVLWQFMKDHHGLECSESSFRRYLSTKPECQAYFSKGQRVPNPHVVVRYETPPGEQAQFDWKENVPYITSDGEKISVNIGVLVLGYSRFRTYGLTLSKSQTVLMSFLTESFEGLGGVPQHLLVDNMKTVMDEHRTKYNRGIVNERFNQFAQDYGFEVKPCIAGRPRTKGKVETIMKLLDEIHAYQGMFTYEELHDFVQKLNTRHNQTFHQGNRKIPLLAYKQEKSHLLPLPRKDLRDSYKVKMSHVKVNPASMITYQSNQYSVPPEYKGKTVQLQTYDDHIHVYHNTELVAVHTISTKVLNYKEAHYIEVLGHEMPSYEDAEELAKKNLMTMDEVYKID
ncbi:IS21 family transposase [Alkalihalobacillus trypoxylicola]|uniref:Transposase n=1 Tax=Alkalihalobacillus trypoxylicola TaxID=519424 RepID=A0A162CXU3_9BACI|nr:IS21 family transposase [Alkalihalobacillus trypoxylicola]KYG27073.1 transposase [Alkalihalobacillus trypoxylicola]